jgi:ribosomal protein S18 acetylase RimI-like enzyme
VELVPASSFDASSLAELFTAGYAGYPLPIQVDAATLGTMVDVFDLELERSRVATRDGTPVGVVLLGLRERAWIGGLGVVAEARRAGVGLALMEAVLDETRAAGVDEVRLEVLEGNDAAIRLYERLGFTHLRILEVWSLDAEAPRSAAVDAPVDGALAAIRTLRSADEPWQRDDGSIANMRARGDAVAAVADGDGGAAVLRVADGRVGVLQLAARDVDGAATLLAGARAGGSSLQFLNVPDGDHASGALESLGGRIVVRQHELGLALST